jgi:hypothetical protein
MCGASDRTVSPRFLFDKHLLSIHLLLLYCFLTVLYGLFLAKFIKTLKKKIFYCIKTKEYLNLPLETIDVYLRHAPETHLNLANSLKKSGRAGLL